MIPDAGFQNNPDKSSQLGITVFLCEVRKGKAVDTRGCLVEFSSHKGKRTTLRTTTTVSELYGVLKGFGTGQYLRSLWTDMSGELVSLEMRTDSNNLVTTALTTHVPQQKETTHMIDMLSTCSAVKLLKAR